MFNAQPTWKPPPPKNNCPPPPPPHTHTLVCLFTTLGNKEFVLSCLSLCMCGVVGSSWILVVGEVYPHVPVITIEMYCLHGSRNNRSDLNVRAFVLFFLKKKKKSPNKQTTKPPCWPSGKASAPRAEDPGFESRLRRDFYGVESYQWLKNWHSSGYPARRLAL